MVEHIKYTVKLCELWFVFVCSLLKLMCMEFVCFPFFISIVWVLMLLNGMYNPGNR